MGTTPGRRKMARRRRAGRTASARMTAGRWKSGTTANIHWKSDGEGKRNGEKLPHCEMVLFGSWSRASGNTSKVCKDKSTVFSRKQRASWAQAGQWRNDSSMTVRQYDVFQTLSGRQYDVRQYDVFQTLESPYLEQPWRVIGDSSGNICKLFLLDTFKASNFRGAIQNLQESEHCCSLLVDRHLDHHFPK